MDRRIAAQTLLGIAAGSLLLPNDARSQTCTAPCYPRTQGEIDASVTPVDYSFEPGNVLRYGAVPNSATSSTTAIMNAIAANKRIRFPQVSAGNTYYTCNLLLENVDDKHIFGDSLGVHLVPGSSSSPVIDVFGSTTGTAGCTGVLIERLLIDSAATGVPSHAGIGIRWRAQSPGFIWKSTLRQVYVRGFQDGVVVDCDINLGEVFDNDFDQLDIVDCSRYSLYLRGVYNRIGRVFATNTGSFAAFIQASRCTIDSIIGDGPISCTGVGCKITSIVIEEIHGAGAAAAVDLNNSEHKIDSIALLNVPAAKCPIGVSVGGVGTDTQIDSITVTGLSYPTTPILLTAGSSGVIGRASIPGGTKITTSTAVISHWCFLGDVSTAFNGDRYLDPSFFVENGGAVKAKAGCLATNGDTGGTLGYVSFSNVQNVSTPRSTGTGSIRFADGSARTNAGFIKIYIDNTAYYLPVFSAN